MEAITQDSTLEEAKAYIYSIDFSMIIDKMVKHLGWLRVDADKVVHLYRNYLFLKRKYGDRYTLPPSEDIDEFWHQHILDTKKYRKDCDMIFGKYVDHYPYFGIDSTSTRRDLDQAFDMTQRLYRMEFGEGICVVRLQGVLGALIQWVKKCIYD